MRRTRHYDELVEGQKVVLTNRDYVPDDLSIRLKQQEFVSQLGQQALEHRHLDELIETAARYVAAGLAVDLLKVSQFDPAQGILVLRCSYGFGEMPLDLVVGDAAASQSAFTFFSDQPVISPDLRTEMRFRASERLLRYGAVSGLSVPIRGHQSPYGVIACFTRIPRSFSQHDINFLQAIANIIASAAERATYEAELTAKNAELRFLNDSLEKHVRERTAQLDEAKNRLAQAQKMQAVGHLTGGLAHDFNNLLTVVIGNLEMLGERSNGDLRSQLLVSAALGAASRGEKLTQQLLAFSRKQHLKPQVTTLNEVVVEMSDLIRRAVGEGVEVQTILAPCLAPCMVDVTQLQNALLNLAINAKDALPGESGTLLIETANVELDDDAEVTAGPYVMVSVCDDGIGMDNDIQQRACEPFFTTKDVGKGSGLGLSQVYGFAKQSQGTIRLKSVPGQGTTVSIFLPRYIAEVESAKHDRGTILVVEDDALIRAMVVSIIGDMGFEVIEAEDGPTAVRAFADRAADILLVFTDIIMPNGLSGFDVAREVRKISPDVKVMFTSGYAESIRARELPLSGQKILSKPYRPFELQQAVESMFDGGR